MICSFMRKILLLKTQNHENNNLFELTNLLFFKEFLFQNYLKK